MPPKKDIFREERLTLILERLVVDKKIYVADLVRDFKLSPSSVRADLAELEDRGLLSRTYGGAILPEQLDSKLVMKKSLLESRDEAHKREKEAIGRAVADLIQDGDTLMIDGGSTNRFVTRHLGTRSGLTIVTNATHLLPDLLAIEDAEIFVAGGQLRRRFETLVGDITIDILGRFNTTKGIIGIDGISTQYGLTSTDPAVAATKRKIISSSKQLIVVCDHTKLDKICLLPVAPLEKMDYLVTDSGADPAVVEAIRDRGPQVVVAPVADL